MTPEQRLATALSSIGIHVTPGTLRAAASRAGVVIQQPILATSVMDHLQRHEALSQKATP